MEHPGFVFVAVGAAGGGMVAGSGDREVDAEDKLTAALKVRIHWTRVAQTTRVKTKMLRLS
jgi:hypothetical protein